MKPKNQLGVNKSYEIHHVPLLWRNNVTGEINCYMQMISFRILMLSEVRFREYCRSSIDEG